MDRSFVIILGFSLLLHALLLSTRYVSVVPPTKPFIDLEVTVGRALSLPEHPAFEKKTALPSAIKPAVTTPAPMPVKKETEETKPNPKQPGTLKTVPTTVPVIAQAPKQESVRPREPVRKEPSKKRMENWLPAIQQHFEPASEGYVLGNIKKPVQPAALNYEMKLSLWLDKFRTYPPEAKAKGLEGEGVVFITIDRAGHIMLARISRSTGYAILDDALMQMVKDANPVLPVPNGYFPEKSSFSYEVAFRFYPDMWQ